MTPTPDPTPTNAERLLKLREEVRRCLDVAWRCGHATARAGWAIKDSRGSQGEVLGSLTSILDRQLDALLAACGIAAPAET